MVSRVLVLPTRGPLVRTTTFDASTSRTASRYKVLGHLQSALDLDRRRPRREGSAQRCDPVSDRFTLTAEAN